MENGLLIGLVLLLVVGVVHVIALKAVKYSEAKKRRLRKLFWYFYGCYFLAYGIGLNAKGALDLLGVGFILIALVFLVANYRGKLDAEPS